MTAKKKKKTLSPSEKSNREILRFTYVIVFLFLCMIGYEGFFLSQKRDEIINNTYNSRLDSFADRVIRGDILSSDGQILAAGRRNRAPQLSVWRSICPCDRLFLHGKDGIRGPGQFLYAFFPYQSDGAGDAGVLWTEESGRRSVYNT